MSDVSVEPLSAVPPTDESQDVFPTWQDLVNNWRAADAHWLRDRVVQIFPNSGTRDSEMASHLSFGMISILQSGSGPSDPNPGGPDFYNANASPPAWESIRYPNLKVTADTTGGGGVNLRYLSGGVAAGSGIRLGSDSSVGIVTLNVTGVTTLGQVNTTRVFAGAAAVGSTLDNTGISIKIGAKTVKLATDANVLTIDSPVKVTGDINGSSLTTAGVLSAGSVSTAGQVHGGTVLADSTVVGTTSVQGGTVMLATSGVYGTVKHSAGGTALVGVGSDSTVRIDGTVTLTGASNFNGRPTLTFAGQVATWVAGIYALAGGPTPPTVNCPDGTIYIVY